MTIPVLFEDDALLVVDKPAGIHVHPSELDRGESSVQEKLRTRYGIDLFPAHRLDRPTSGVLIFAKTPHAASVLGAAFRERLVSKTYRALVRGWPVAERVDAVVRDEPRGKHRFEAESEFVPLERYDLPWAWRGFDSFRCAWLEVRPLTGRRHQIRQHCTKRDHPIVGDTTWGDTKLNAWLAPRLATNRLFLTCVSLAFDHPETGTRISIEAPLPEDVQEALTRLRAASSFDRVDFEPRTS